jgi:hypothetical protein
MIIYQVSVYIVVYLRDIYLMCVHGGLTQRDIYHGFPLHHLLQFCALLSMEWVYMELDKYHCAMTVPSI